MKKTLIFWPSLKNFCIAVSAIAIALGPGFIHRINAQLDPTFGTNGVTTFADNGSRLPINIFALPDGKTMVFSSGISAADGGPFDFVRLNADGSADTSYGNNGIIRLSFPFISGFGFSRIHGAAMQPDGKIILVGTDDNRGLVLRFNADGTLDQGFANGGIDRPDVSSNGSDSASTVLIQPDGKIVVGGTSTGSVTFLIRYNANGTLDTGFGNQGYRVPGTDGLPKDILMQSTGKYVALIGASNSGVLTRLNADGSLDNSFPSDGVHYVSVAVQPDDKILVGITTDRNESVGRVYTDPLIKRFNADGTIDNSFGTNGSLTFYWAKYMFDGGGALAITPLPDGQILLSGHSYIPGNRSKYKGATGTAALLSSAGVVTGKFLLPGFPGTSLWGNVAVFPNGKFVFAGGSEVSNSNYRMHFARITGVPHESYWFKGNPFDLFGDGIADAIVYRPSDMLWYGQGGFPFGTTSDILVPADYIKTDFSAEIAYFRPSTGDWYISPNNGRPQDTIVIHWGQNGDIPVPADFDGDTKADLAVFRPSTGDWYIRNSTDNSFTALHWGATGDKPVPGDYDGDGRDDIAVFRPSTGDWYIVKSGGGFLFLHFGANGDIPVQEDYDGDGKADISVWRPSDGTWYRLNSSDGSFYGLHWGLSTDIPVPADYDGDFKTDISVWRPSDRIWYIFSSSTNTMKTIFWGQSTDIPVAARH